MKVYRGFFDRALKKKPRRVAIGIFDGVHRAHAKILRHVDTVLTFDPHPRKVLSGDHKNPPILMSLEHRLRVIESLGVKEAVVVLFDRKFSLMGRADFLNNLLDRLGMTTLAVGHDFRFGHRALGTTAYLREQSRIRSFKLFVCPPLKWKGRIISSTAIRRRIESGDLRQAAAKLGRPVSIYGTVVHGSGRGHGIGFPTANLDPHHETLPPDGVYAVTGDLNGKKLKGVLHIGKRPTFGLKKRSVEVHLFDMKKDLYGREIELFFVKKLRGIRRFKNAQALGAAIRKDIRLARMCLR